MHQIMFSNWPSWVTLAQEARSSTSDSDEELGAGDGSELPWRRSKLGSGGCHGPSVPRCAVKDHRWRNGLVHLGRFFYE